MASTSLGELLQDAREPRIITPGRLIVLPLVLAFFILPLQGLTLVAWALFGHDVPGTALSVVQEKRDFGPHIVINYSFEWNGRTHVKRDDVVGGTWSELQNAPGKPIPVRVWSPLGWTFSRPVPYGPLVYVLDISGIAFVFLLLGTPVLWIAYGLPLWRYFRQPQPRPRWEWW